MTFTERNFKKSILIRSTLGVEGVVMAVRTHMDMKRRMPVLVAFDGLDNIYVVVLNKRLEGM